MTFSPWPATFYRPTWLMLGSGGWLLDGLGLGAAAADAGGAAFAVAAGAAAALAAVGAVEAGLVSFLLSDAGGAIGL